MSYSKNAATLHIWSGITNVQMLRRRYQIYQKSFTLRSLLSICMHGHWIGPWSSYLWRTLTSLVTHYFRNNSTSYCILCHSRSWQIWQKLKCKQQTYKIPARCLYSISGWQKANKDTYIDKTRKYISPLIRKYMTAEKYLYVSPWCLKVSEKLIPTTICCQQHRWEVYTFILLLCA